MAEFEDWYRRAHPRVIGVVLVACGDIDVAVDATDEAFARTLANWRRVSEMASPDGWVCRVAVNVMKRRLRRRSLERRLLLGRRAPEAAEMVEPNPELWREVGRLPERQRLAVLLRYVMDLPDAEVGAVMGISRGTVSASLVAARTRLAEALGRPELDVEELESPYV